MILDIHGKQEYPLGIRLRECANCEHRYRVSYHRRAIDRDSCPECGSSRFSKRVHSVAVVGLGDVAGVSKIYPYFDRGLQIQINSAQHRKQIAKRLNVTPVDGDIDLEKGALRARYKREDAKARYAQVLKEQKAECPAAYAIADKEAKRKTAEFNAASAAKQAAKIEAITKANHDRSP